ncbi:MAG: acyltransferase [Bacteroidaceae bacterium]|nr:acyltransferase [Bacteroidaceae bacterium]
MKSEEFATAKMELNNKELLPPGEGRERGHRIEWLDAMRGFTMILVVAYHVAQFGFVENEKTSAALPFLVLFRMPLFFFVSGFLAYKANFVWNLKNTVPLVLKKLHVQIIPAIIFLGIFIVFKSKHSFWDGLLNALKSPTKDGYWFTWVLLQMFLIYYTISIIAHYLKKIKEKVSGKNSQLSTFNFQFSTLNSQLSMVFWITVWLISIAAYETLYLPKHFSYHKAQFFAYTSLIQTIRFMQFFLLGDIVHRYWNRIQKLFDSVWFFPLIATLALVCCADIFRLHTLKFAWTNLPRTTAMYTLLLMVVMFFRYNKKWFTTEHALGRALQYTGQRTLDVYLLHFLLIPSMPFIGTWLNAHHPNFLIDLLLSVGVALPIVAVCLLISHILHTSPVLGKFLFGK